MNLSTIVKPWRWVGWIRKKRSSTDEAEQEREVPSQAAIGDPVVTKDIEPIPYGKRIGKVKVFACTLHKPNAEIVPAKIIHDHWLVYKTSDGVKHETIIAGDAYTLEQRAGRAPFASRKRQLVFFAGQQAEATHDPARCQYDIPVLEGIIKMAKAITKTDILAAAAQQIKVKKGFWEVFPYIVILIMVFLFLFAILQLQGAGL